ncbi:MAG TPA: ABC transporter ATP-binding protein [Oscillospiraceae bacterium]|nr:ABC transporter ATP-binding protein [Oscillospiraceae bacterium]
MIEIRHLTKRYGAHTAVSDLNLTVESGQIYGFLGPNGAGKSTTMNIVTGCLAATEGQVLIDGHDIFEDAAEAKRRIGYLPEQPPLYPDLTCGEYLRFVAKAKGVRRADLERQLSHVMEVTQIADMERRLIRNLSKGYRQRVGIAQALLGEPEVVILDEPTVGLDPLQIIEIRDLVKTLGKDHTVILSSHILSEVRAVCDRIMILSKGKLVASDTPENLEALFAGTASLDLTVRAGEPEAREILGAVEGAGLVTILDPEVPGALSLAVETDAGADISEAVFFAFSRAGLPILRMALSRASLEDVFLELTSEKPVEEATDQVEEISSAEEKEPAEPEEEKEASGDDGNL